MAMTMSLNEAFDYAVANGMNNFALYMWMRDWLRNRKGGASILLIGGGHDIPLMMAGNEENTVCVLEESEDWMDTAKQWLNGRVLIPQKIEYPSDKSAPQVLDWVKKTQWDLIVVDPGLHRRDAALDLVKSLNTKGATLVITKSQIDSEKLNRVFGNTDEVMKDVKDQNKAHIYRL